MRSDIIDENTRPLTRSVTRAKNAFTILNDSQHPTDKRGKVKQSGTTKRSALGDVTNRQTSHQDGTKQSIKKSGSIPASKTRVIRKTTTRRSILSPSPSKQFAKHSPMCISNDLEEMTIGKTSFDIDSVDASDEFSVWQYAESVFAHYFSIEKSRMPDPTYMGQQTDINSKMRAILIDWLIDVHAKYGLVSQTLHICINLVDRYLAINNTVPRQKLQLVGITALFIASKYEEIYPPEVYDFVRITDNAYSVEEVFSYEEKMLKALSYRITSPTAWQFLGRFIKAAGNNTERTKHFAHYVIDRTLQEYRMIKYSPSQIAAAALYIARTQMEETPIWHSTLEYHTRNSSSCILPCVQEIKAILWSAQNEIGKSSRLTAVKRKFSKDKFLNVSLLKLAATEDMH